MRVVSGSVQRIDNPFPVASAFAHNNRFTRLFGQDGMPRIVRTNPFDDQLFSGDVSLGNEVNVTFVRDSGRAEALDKKLSSFERDLFGGAKLAG